MFSFFSLSQLNSNPVKKSPTINKIVSILLNQHLTIGQFFHTNAPTLKVKTDLRMTEVL